MQHDKLDALIAFGNAPIEERVRIIKEALDAKPKGNVVPASEFEPIGEIAVAGPYGRGDMGHRYFGFDRTG